MLALLLLATAAFADKWGLEDKDAKFFERVREAAAKGATVKRARAFRNAFAKKPDLELLRGLAWLVGDEHSSIEARRGAHILLLVMTGVDVATPDRDLWFPHTAKFVTPRSPSPGEVRAAVQLGAAWLYGELDRGKILRQRFLHPKEKNEFDPPSICATATALIALHRCGVPKRDPLITQTLLMCRTMIDTPRYAKARAIRYVGPGNGRRSSLYRDYAALVWALCELGAEPPENAVKRLLPWPKGDGHRWWDHYLALYAVRALRRRGIEINARHLASIERVDRRDLLQAKRSDAYGWYAMRMGRLINTIKALRPATSAAQLRNDAAFRPHLKPIVNRRWRPQPNAHWYLIPMAQVRDDLALRTYAIENGRRNPYEPFVSDLIEQQQDAGNWKPHPSAWMEYDHVTAPALIFLAGELVTGTKAQRRK